MKRILAVGCMIFIMTGCTTVPITNRTQLAIVPMSEMISLSETLYREQLSEATISTDTASQQRVENIGKKIAAATEAFLRDNGQEQEIAQYAWEFTLIEDQGVNAFALPGGKVGVYTGILPVAKNDAGLAVIISHEIAHAVAQHGRERMSQEMLLQLGGMGIEAAMKTKPEKTKEIWMQAYSIGANIGYLLPYSRLHESEADRIGIVLMARAGYDPREAVALWQRMNDLEKTRPPEFLSTHPAPDTRIDDIKRYVPEALEYYKKAGSVSGTSTTNSQDAPYLNQNIVAKTNASSLFGAWSEE